MIWQDILLVVCNVLMGYALVPQIWNNFKCKKCGISAQTSGVTTIALFVAAFAYFTLNLFFTFILAIVMGIFWFIFFVQRIIYK